MKLKELTLTGFKSFKHRTVLEFRDGITAIIGPNGCGKSNVVDAIFWVLGEQSPKHLRTRHMSDVIFSGSATQSASGYAEVSMTFEATGFVVPKEYGIENVTDISVARRLYADGDSEYFINGKRCRLKDLVSIFLDSGLVGSAYAIIEQGMISRLIENKPQDWSMLIQEVAGLTKYKVKKDEASRKMKKTREHCTRVEDLIQELETQKVALENQVHAARKYKVCSLELESTKRDAVLHEVFIGKRQLSDHQRCLTQTQDKEAALQVKLNESQTQMEKLSSDLKLKEAVLTQKRDVLSGQQRKLESSKLESNTLYHTRDRLSLVLKQVDQDVSRIYGQVEDFERRKVQDLSQKTEMESELKQFMDENETMVAKHDTTQEQTKTLTHTLEHQKQAYDVCTSVVSEKQLDLQRVKTQLETSESQHQDLLAKGIELKTKLEELQGKLKDILAKQANHKEHSENLQSELMNSQVTLRGNETEIQETESLFQANKHELEGLHLKVKQVRHMLEAQSALDMISHIPEGIHSLADMIEPSDEVPQEELYRFLHLFKHVWTCDSESGFEDVVQSLPKDRTKGVVVAYKGVSQIETDAVSKISDLHPEAKKVWDPIWSGSHVPGLLSKPLYEVPAVSDLLNIRQNASTPLPCHFRSQEGVVLLDDGWFYFPPTKEDVSDVFHHKAHEAELLAKIDEKTKKHDAFCSKHESLDKAHTELSEKEESLETELADAKQTLQEVTLEFKQIEIEKNHQDKHVSENIDLICNIGNRIEAYRKNVLMIQAEVTENETKCRELKESCSKIAQELDALTHEGIRLKARYDIFTASKGDREIHIARLSDEIKRIEEQVNDLKAQAELQKLNRDEYVKEQQDTKTKFECSSVEVEKLKSDCESYDEQVKSLGQEVHVIFDQREKAGGELHSCEREHSEIESQIFQLNTQIDAVVVLLSEVEPQLVDVSINMDLPVENLEALKKFLIKLKRQTSSTQKTLDAMGDVNLLAIHQYEEASERLIFLQTQREDLLTSLVNLETTISEIQGSVRETFLKTFAEVNTNFKRYFTILFKGGEGYLKLSSEDEVDGIPGILLFAAPPGKKVKHNMLLSGGEKALVALALIISLFHVKPSPFLVLDEVDSPFDETNVGAFIDLCRHLSSVAQVLLITHNKRTMQSADTLYGVTMKEKGVAQAVSVRLGQAGKPHSAPTPPVGHA